MSVNLSSLPPELIRIVLGYVEKSKTDNWLIGMSGQDGLFPAKNFVMVNSRKEDLKMCLAEKYRIMRNILAILFYDEGYAEGVDGSDELQTNRFVSSLIEKAKTDENAKKMMLEKIKADLIERRSATERRANPQIIFIIHESEFFERRE